MENKEKLLEKIFVLLAQGDMLGKIANGNITQYTKAYFKVEQLVEFFEWRDKIDFLIRVTMPSGNPLQGRLNEIRSTNDTEYLALHRNFQERFAFLKFFKTVIENNQLDSWQYAVSAQDFSEFLEHAKDYHLKGSKDLAGVITSAVLEDTIKKIATKYGIELQQDGKYKKSELLIDELVTARAFNATKAKMIKSNGALRNKASHANWDDFDFNDVKRMIQDVEQLIADYLYPKP
jgi:hypothetical protein